VSIRIAALFIFAVVCATASSFGIGDRVALTVNHPDNNSSLVAGDQGTVVCVFQPTEGYSVLVSWDKAYIGHNGFGSCINKASQGRGWAVYDYQIRKLSSGSIIGPPPITPPTALTKTQQSPQQSATFFWVNELGVFPIYFSGVQGSMTARYTTTGSGNATLTQLDQVVFIPYYYGPCDIGMGVNTALYNNGGANYVMTIYPQRGGSFLFSSTTRWYGGTSDVNYGGRNLLLSGSGFMAASGECYGWRSVGPWTMLIP
jgi:hypothetical protein